MQSTMQQVPLLISRILDHASTAYGTSEVVTWGADGARRTTYADLGQDCRRLANALAAIGVVGDQRVGTFMWNNEEHLELYLAVPSMGAVLHPINIRLFPAQMIYVINHAEDRVVVVDNTLAEPFSKLLEHLPTVEQVIVNGPVPDAVRAGLGAGGRAVHSYRALLDSQPPEYDWPVLDENSAASMCYTSGTTGKPRGVAYSHRSNVLHTMQVALPTALSLREGDRVLTVVPLFHANSWGLSYAGPMTGATLVLPDRFLQPEALAQIIAAEGVTKAAAVPTIWAGLLKHLEENPDVDISSLRTVLIGGSACPPALMRAFEERHGVEVLHGWGMTETSPLGSVAVPPAASSGEQRWAYRESQGRLSSLIQARLIGPDGSVLPWDGEGVGELEVRGPWVTGSYYVRPGEEPQADDLARFDDGWLRTGDVGSLTPDGYLRLTDRSKDVIKSGGEWISSVELENQLMAHPGVAEASVIGVPDETWGERPLAVVVLAPGSAVTVQQLREFLGGRVAHWQVPDRWSFVDEVPKTSVGKFDKKVLRRRYADGELAPAPQGDSSPTVTST